MLPADLILCVVLSAVPPLTDDQRLRLETAQDGRDHQEEAFSALLENARQWTPGTGDAPLRLQPDLDIMMGGPDEFRGDLCRVAGVLQQDTRLSPPYDDVAEWFVRDEAGRPILVYVSGLRREHPYRPGRAVVLAARFYKRVDAIALDGRLHRYPAFVGAFPRPAVDEAATWGRLWAVVVPVAIMLVVFMLLLVYARHGARRSRRPAAVGAWPTSPEEALPEDPADALAELRRRAEAGG